MGIGRLVKIAINSLLSKKSRTFLTMLGIMIGIASVIVVLALGNGAQQSIETSVSNLGANTLTIQGGNNRGAGGVFGPPGANQTLTLTDLAEINKLKLQNIGILGVSPDISTNQSQQVIAGANNINASVVAGDQDYMSVRNYSIDQGYYFDDLSDQKREKVAVLGYNTKIALFGEGEATGQKIKIKNQLFSVIGTFKQKGSVGFGSSDDIVVIPFKTYLTYFSGNTARLRSITVQVLSKDSLSTVQALLNDTLLATHKISSSDSADFTIRNSQEFLSALSSVSTTLTLLLSGVAGVSLIVGGIGIMNTMIITITERTREIGLRKAVGANDGVLVMQFVVEAVLLTFAGGIMGIFLGWIISFVISFFNISATSVSLFSVILSAGVSVVIGLVFGVYPAIKAGKLSPIEALRYE